MVIFVVFPLFLSCKVGYFGETKKIYFSFSLFGFIKVFGGYVEFFSNGFAIHYRKKKAFFVFYKKLFGMRKSFKPLQDYHFIKLKTCIDVGKNNHLTDVFIGSFLFNYLTRNIEWFYKIRKPYYNLKNYINIYEDEDIFNFYFDALIIFNFLMIILSFIKIITEKLIYAISKGKQSKSGN